jgi:flagellum-specific ATP synthase
MRIRAAKTVVAIAEYFSQKGKRVLLMMDSLTRVAQAQREIGLAIGEPPTTKGYTPSVFSLLPKLLERCGTSDKGSISGLFTVLVDGDDFNDPIPDSVRAIADGHIVLSRALAAKNYFPAIDIPASLSRVMNDVVDDSHKNSAQIIRSLIATYNENFDYIQMGAYQAGTNTLLDLAIRFMPTIERYLKQDLLEKSNFLEAIEGIKQITKAIDTINRLKSG